MLQSVALAAARVARQEDCVARIGGDEFALLAPADSIEPAATYAAAMVPDDARTPDELVACADARLLAQKRDVKRMQAPHA